MNRRQMLSASAVVAGASVASCRTDAASFGVRGDGVADDAPAIQAALNETAARGGGTVYLPAPKVHYRLATGLRLPSFVTLEGNAPVRYPFNRANRGACALVADFEDPRQWVIEPATLVSKKPVPFDRLVEKTLPDGVTYNCSVRNLLITSKGKLPYGGIRMHGCPGSTVVDVAIDRVGCGLLVNYSFGGTYRVHVEAMYYGVAIWDDANANTFDLYCSQHEPWPRAVPRDYWLRFMVELENNLVPNHKLSTEEHLSRPFGVLCGAIESTSVNNVLDVTIEQFRGGLFLLNAYATDFRRCYVEGDRGRVSHAIVASRSRFSIQALHAYQSGDGMLFDFGTELKAKIYGSGILHTGGFGKAPAEDGSSLLILEGVDPGPLGASIRYAARPQPWRSLSLQGNWRVAEGYEPPAVRFDPWSHRVEFRGAMQGGRAGSCFVLPTELRPSRRMRHSVRGGEIDFDTQGSATTELADTLVTLDGLSFARW